MLKKMWTKIKDWSGWSAAGTIFMARLEAAITFLCAATLGIDWSALMRLDFTNGINKTVVAGFAILFARAILVEVVRRRNATDL